MSVRWELLAAIPAELQERPQWVVWRSELVADRAKPTKVPYQAAAPQRHASSTDPATWATLRDAALAAMQSGSDGIGIVFTAEDPYCGIDIEVELGDDAKRDIVARLASYTERSVSGGLHVIVRATLNGAGRHPSELGAFDCGRYFVMTGDHIDGTPLTIEPRQAELDAVLADYMPAPPSPQPAAEPHPVELDDHALLTRMFAATNGGDVHALYDGQWQDRYSSHSEADLALAGALAFWTGGDRDRIDRLFRTSGLMRDKWLRDDYRERTIVAALAGRTAFYDSRSPEGFPQPFFFLRPMKEPDASSGRAKPSTKETKKVCIGEDELSLPPNEKNELDEESLGDAAYQEKNELDEESLGDAAYQGLAGRIVQALAPTTEAPPEGILVSLLTMFGNAVGSRPYVQVGADRHRAILFAVLVGLSGSGRKGMSMSHGEQVVALADTVWRDRVVRGLVSGEGVIWHVRDPRIELDPKTGDEKVTDEGVKDKRLFVREDELASVLAAMAREGSTLSAVLRDAWDARRLQTLAKRAGAKATGAHISVLGAITPDEVRQRLAATEQANGFANRFLWISVRRSRLLPDGAAVDDALLRELAAELRDALAHARNVDGVLRDDDAKELWHDVYAHLTRDVPGMTGAMRSRAESQVLRLSLCYALLDGDRLIRRPHIEAALAVWEYAERSLFDIFGHSLGDATADRTLAALRAEPNGLTRTDLFALFSRNLPAREIDRALGVLARVGLAVFERAESGGRPVERWHAVADTTTAGAYPAEKGDR